jgi:hypothetical protein
VAKFPSDRRPVASVLLFALCTVFAPVVRAERPRTAESTDESTTRARAEFVAATEHVKNARWGEALAAFERSAALRPHALTAFNIGACERALGRYADARESLRKALEANDASAGKELAAAFVSDAKKWSDDIDRLLVRAVVVVRPSDATLLVDGSPPPPSAFAGEKVELVLDPGSHVFRISRPGYASAVLSKTLEPGSTPELVFDLARLPAILRIAADRSGAVVTVNDLDVGVAPVQVTRPAGTYAVAVRKPGFLTYESRVRVGPGEQPSILATLPAERTPITKKVWFWSAAAAIVAGAATGTYLLTRPAPQRPEPNGGGLGWVVTVPASP